MKYRCKVCGQIVEVAEGEPCPICGASHDKLVPIEEAPKASELNGLVNMKSESLKALMNSFYKVVEIISKANVVKLACIWQWPVKHLEKAILKLHCS